MKIKEINPGDVLYIAPEGLTVLVVMSGDDGIRYIEPMNPQFNNNGCVESTYVSYNAMSEWTISLGSVDSISKKLLGR